MTDHVSDRGPRRESVAVLPLLTAALALGGCVRAEIAVVDSRTALEVQAAGEMPPLEHDLTQASLSAAAEDIPREALAASDARADLGPVAALYASAETDQEALDRWLVAGCVGEGLDGLLAARIERCRDDVDAGELARLVGRTNVHRRQVWDWLRSKEPEASEGEVREAWRAVHIERVVCGGLVERGPGAWEPKPC